MRLYVLSDLHLETGKDFVPCELVLEQADAVVLAGDIHVRTHGLIWARKTFKEKKVFYVPGNHEFEGGNAGGLLREMRRVAKEEGVSFLNDNEEEFMGFRFRGATLWTDFCLYGQEKRGAAQFAADKWMPESSRTTMSGGRFLRASDTRKWHLESRKFFEASESRKEKTIFISHHAPSSRSIIKKFDGSVLSAAFASNLDSLSKKACLWIHGHTHIRQDYQTNEGCRIFSNPRGYPGEETLFEEVIVYVEE